MYVSQYVSGHMFTVYKHHEVGDLVSSPLCHLSTKTNGTKWTLATYLLKGKKQQKGH